MSTLGEYPALCEAIKELNSESDRFNCEYSALEVPGALEQLIGEAEEGARMLRGNTVRDFLVLRGDIENLCLRTKTSPDEDSLLLLVSGQRRMREALFDELKRRNIALATALEEILDSAFEGQLNAYWYKRHGQ